MATYIFYEIKNAFKNKATILSVLISETIVILILPAGFGNIIDKSYSKSLAIGLVSIMLITISIVGSIELGLEIVLKNKLRFEFSLPVSLNLLAIGKIIKIIVLNAVMLIYILTLVNILYLNLNIKIFVLVYLYLLIQTIILSGISASISTIISKNIKSITVINSLLISGLQYLSTIYFPVEKFPAYLKPIVMLNPLTYSINFVKGIVLNNIFNLKTFYINIFTSIFWLIIGFLFIRYSLKKVWQKG